MGASYLVLVRQYEPDKAAALYRPTYRHHLGTVCCGLHNRPAHEPATGIPGAGTYLFGRAVPVPTGQYHCPAGLFSGRTRVCPHFSQPAARNPAQFRPKALTGHHGLQMASAYVGITLMPLLFGKLASYLGYSSLPAFLGVALLAMVYMTYDLNRKVAVGKGTSVPSDS